MIAPLASSVGLSEIFTNPETTLEPIAPDEAVRLYLRDRQFIVVDDVGVSDLSDEGPWTWYAPSQFVETVEAGDFALEEPPFDAYRNDGVPFNSTDDPDFELEVPTVDEIRGKLRGSDHLDNSR